MMTASSIPEAAPPVLPVIPADRGPWTIERLAAIDGVYAVRMYTEAGGQEEAGAMDVWLSAVVAAEAFVSHSAATAAGDIQIHLNESQRVRVAWQGDDCIVIVHGSNCKATKAMPRALVRQRGQAGAWREGARGEAVNMITVALIAYIAATAIGMSVGSLVPFWLTVGPLVVLAGAAVTVADLSTVRSKARGRVMPVASGAIWGALAGAFAASTCGPTHARSLLGSEVSAVVMALVAIALVLVADMLPRAVDSRPHALCGLLFLSTVGLALALGAEVPAWPR